MIHPCIILACIIAFTCSCSSLNNLEKQNPVISNLRAGESVKIEYSSIGCFGGSEYEMTFVPAGGQIEASGVEIWGFGKNQKRIMLAPIILRPSEIQGLERLIRKFRTPPPENVWTMSTTVSNLAITKSSGGKVILRESLDDSKGNIVSGSTSIPDLAKRMPKIRN